MYHNHLTNPTTPLIPAPHAGNCTTAMKMRAPAYTKPLFIKGGPMPTKAPSFTWKSLQGHLRHQSVWLSTQSAKLSMGAMGDS